MQRRFHWRVGGTAVLVACAGALLFLAGATAGASGTVGSFSYGELQAQTTNASGCGTNIDGEPAVEVSNQNNLFLGSERGLGGGSDGWRETPALGGAGADPCAAVYAGQPNAVAGTGASGGDIDLAWGSAPAASGNDPLYVASLNLGSVAVAHSTDNGHTFLNVPVQGGLPVDDREWVAAYGATTSLLTFHDIATFDIDVLRSDDGGLSYHQISQAIPATDYKASNNELGNVAIDRLNTAGAAAGQFWVYQSYVAPSSAPKLTSGGSYNEAFLAVSNDGGFSWTQRPIGCSVSSRSLDHQFPNVSVDPAGTVWVAWSDDLSIFVAHSSDHGATWACEKASTTPQSVMPWLAAASGGVDLVYYGTPSSPCKGKTCNPTWYVYFAQRLNGTWQSSQLMPVHTGTICESGFSCSSGRQLYDDFGVDVDRNGYAHIAYSHDAPNLGGSDTYTGYAVQTSGTTIGVTN